MEVTLTGDSAQEMLEGVIFHCQSLESEDEMMEYIMNGLYANMVAMALAGYTGKDLEGILIELHSKVEPVYEYLRKTFEGKRYDA